MSITNLSFDLNLVPAGHALKIKKNWNIFTLIYSHCIFIVCMLMKNLVIQILKF